MNPYKDSDYDTKDLNEKRGHKKRKSKKFRHKRNTKGDEEKIKKKLCSVLLVADYKFTNQMGNGEVKLTTWYLVSIKSFNLILYGISFFFLILFWF